MKKNRRGVIRPRNLESGFESESTLFFLNPNPDSYSVALNPNPDPNPAQKALNPDSNPNPDSHITGTGCILSLFKIDCMFCVGIFQKSYA